MKKYFKLMSLFLGLMICTPAFVACGDDDDDDTPAAETPATPAGPTSVVGKWVGEWAANPNSDDELMWRYAHKLFYTIKADNTFEIVESACYYTNESYDKEYDQPSIAIDPARPSGYYLVERIVHCMRGTYTLPENNKITLKFLQEGWGGDEQVQMESMGEYAYEETFAYTISGNTLKVGDGSLVAVSPHNLIVYDVMTYQGQ
jgi:hypothetical protein